MFARKKAATNTDAGIEQIDALERDIVRAHDEKVTLGASVEEIARLRPGVVQVAKTVTDQLRAEYRARTPQA